MKTRKTAAKVIAVLLSVIMLLGVLPVSAFANSAPTEFGGSDSVKIGYEDGILTVLFSADKIAEIVKKRSLTAEDLENMLPGEFTDDLREKGFVGILLTEHITNIVRFGELLRLIPDEVLTASLTYKQLTALVPLDVVMNRLPVEQIAQMLTNDQIKDVLKLDILKERLASANVNFDYKTLLNDLTTDQLLSVIDLEYAVSQLDISDVNYTDLITDLSVDELKSIVDTDSLINDLGDDIPYDTIKGDLADLTDEQLVSIAKDPTMTADEIKIALAGGAEVNDVLDVSKLFEIIDLFSYVDVDTIASDIKPATIKLDALRNLDALKNNLFDYLVPTVDQLIDRIGTDHFDLEAVLDFDINLFDYLLDTPAEVLDKIGIDVVDVEKLLSKYITFADIVDLLTDDDLDVIAGNADKTQLKNFAIRVVNNLLPSSESITLNGDEIWDYDNYKFSPEAIQKALLKGLPTMETFENIPDDRIVASYELVFTYDDTITSRADTTVGVKFGFYGTDSNIHSLESKAARLFEYVQYEITGDERLVDTDALIPQKVSNWMTAALTSDEIPASEKNDLIRLFSGTVNDTIETARKYALTLSDFGSEENASLLKDIYTATKLDYVQKLGELLDTERPGARKALAKLKELLVDFIGSFDSIDEAFTALNIMEDIYQGDGEFEYDFWERSSIDFVFNKLRARIADIDQFRVYFKDEAVDTHFTGTATFRDLHEVRFMDENDEVMFVTYLPEGIEFDLIKTYIQEVAGYDWVFEDRVTPAETVPARDCEVYIARQNYVITFVDDGGERYVEYEAGNPLTDEQIPEITPREGHDAIWVVIDPTDGSETPFEDYYYYEGDFTVTAKYTAKIYKVIFMADGVKVATVEYRYGTENIDQFIPEVPEKEGQTGEWEAFELNTAEEIYVNAIYTTKIYKVIFVADGQTIAEVEYEYGAESIDEPSVPAKDGHSGRWEDYELNTVEELTVNAIYDTLTYKVIFVDENGEEIETVEYPYGTQTITEPAVPEKEGYTGEWEAYQLNTAEEITVHPVYTAKTYKVIFKADGATVAEVEYQYGAESITEPTVPEKTGYTGAWEAYQLNTAEEITVNAVYTAKTYKVIFVADGAKVATVEYKYGDATINEPAVPEKEGYTGAWEAYTLGSAEEITVNAVYTAKTYKVIFMADGEVVAEVEYEYGADSITVPEVPAKEGFTGVWDTFELNTAEEITVNAIYTQLPPTGYVDSVKGIVIGYSLAAVIGLTALAIFLAKKRKKED